MNHSGKPERSGLIYVVCVLMTFSGCTALSVQKSTRDVSSVAHPEITARSYNASPPVVAQAAINAMTQLGWSMVPEQSNFPSTLVASVPMSVWTSGDTVQVVLTEQSPGQTTVDISSRTVGQMYDWGKNKENIDRFYGALNF